MMRWLIIIPIFVLAVSCGSRTVYVPVPTVRTEYKDVFLRDSIHLHDSILVRMANDTVWMERYKTVYRNRLLRDSVFMTDSIQVPYPVVEVKERRVYPLWLIVPAMLGCLVVGWGVFRIVNKLH